MTRAQKIAKAKALRAKGLSNAQIGQRFGVTESAVWKWLNPERTKEIARRSNAKPETKAAKRAWEREHDRGVCVSCGEPTGIGAERKAAQFGFPGRCAVCRIAEENERVAERGHQIEALWAEGLTIAQVAERIGMSQEVAWVEIERLREKGFDLPYRRTPVQRKRMREARWAA